MAFDLTQFKDVFLSEADDHLEHLNTDLLQLEKQMKKRFKGGVLTGTMQPEEMVLLDSLMRSSHTIKSSAATMGFTKMAFFTHVLEDVFDYARHLIFPLDLKMIDEIFAGLDALRASIHSIKKSNVELDVEAISQRIKSITGVGTQGIGKSIRDEAGNPMLNTSFRASDVPILSVQTSDPEHLTEGEQISHIKVPVTRLDALMDLTEEIIIGKMRITAAVEETTSQPISIADISKREALLAIKPTVDHLSRLLSSLQYTVMQIRLVPVGSIFARFPRMLRDLAKTKNKEVELIMRGEELEVDRSIIDKLGQPLVHLLRNAVDHGLEQGGQILLEAKREKDVVLIIVEDNGTGIRWDKVVESAFEKKLISEKLHADLVARMKASSSNEWQRDVESLLYLGRLSTNSQVTETSGRGVGLSVVKKFVEEIGGSISIESPAQEHGGTRFILELPLTLAITEALLVSIQDETFAIPLSSIDRVVKVKNEDVKSMGDQDVAIVNGIEVPLVNAERIFHLQLKKKSTNVGLASASVGGLDQTVVLAHRGRDVAGIVIDRVLYQQEIIVKPLSHILTGVKGFSGSTILGNGDVVLILDIVSLLRNTHDLLRTNL